MNSRVGEIFGLESLKIRLLINPTGLSRWIVQSRPTRPRIFLNPAGASRWIVQSQAARFNDRKQRLGMNNPPASAGGIAGMFVDFGMQGLNDPPAHVGGIESRRNSRGRICVLAPEDHFAQYAWASKRFDSLAPVTFQVISKFHWGRSKIKVRTSCCFIDFPSTRVGLKTHFLAASSAAERRAG